MRGPSTRPRGDENLPSRLGRTDETVEILARRISRVSTAKQTPSGGGIVGVAEVRAVTSSLITAGAQELQLNFIEYDAPADPTAGTAFTGLDPSGWCTTEAWGINLDEGWYDITVSCEIGWTVSNAPSSFYALVFCQAAGGVLFPNNQPIYRNAITDSTGSRRGFSDHLAYGPSYVAGQLSFELAWGAYSGGADALKGVYELNPYLVWTIRKYG